MKIISENLAWRLARKSKRSLPYRGYSLILDDGSVISNAKDGTIRLFDSPKELEQAGLSASL